MKFGTHLFSFILIILLSFSSIAQQKGNIDDRDSRNASHQSVIFSPSRTDLISEGFEGASFPPAGWTQVIQNAGFTWKSQTLSPYSGLKSCDIEYDPALVPQNEWLITPSFSLAGASTATASFYFNTSYYWHVTNNNADMWLKVSTDNGATWTSIWREEDYGLFTNWVWYQASVSLTPYVGNANVKLAFNYIGSDGAQFNIDQIVVNVPCEVGTSSNPTPANAAVDIAVNSVQLSWTNPGNATTNKVYFGTDASNLTMVHSGSLASYYSIGTTLAYKTKYYWRVDEANANCETPGTLWSFTTIQDPNVYIPLDDDFSNGTGLWTITNNGGTCLWLTFATPYPNSYTLPPASVSPVFAADADECGSGTTTLTTATLTNAIDFSLYQTVMLEFDSDWRTFNADDFAYVEVSNNGTTWVPYLTYDGTSVRNTHVVLNISATAALQPNVKIRFRTIQPGWHWWWAIDNVQLFGTDIIPVELASFKADVHGNAVTLNWMTATETNNNGFDVERSYNGGAYEILGFVSGNGTTSEMSFYNFTDSKVSGGKYTYRLRQIDFDGSFEYSHAIEVEVTTPSVFALGQNYPNPFNPSTKIDFSLAADSKVSLRIFDILGQEVALLLDQNMNAGSHTISFDASKLITGMYIYKLEADAVDGTNFTNIKKMLLVK
jgi:hypothetical protein